MLRNAMLPPNAWLRWEAVRALLPTDAESILEIGCGQGGFAPRLARRYRYVGLEPDEESFAVARARLGGAGEVRHGDLSVLDADESFDVVCAFEVVEHMEDDRGAIEGWLQHVRPGGWLLLSAPAWSQRYSAWDELVGHYRRYDPPALAALLREVGLEQTEAFVFGAPLGYALEAVRNALARRRLAAASAATMVDRTAGSGRLLKPRHGTAAFATYLAALPFRKLQRALPGKGVGLVARGRRPELV